MRIHELCETVVAPHEAAVVDLLREYSTGAHKDATNKEFSEAMCGRDVVGMCTYD